MNSREAQQILLLYRPGTADSHDPQIAEALAVASQDPALREWLEGHKVFQTQVRQKMREIPVPPNLKERILAERKIIRLHWWGQPALLAAAAVVLVLAVAGIFLFREPRPDRFADYRARMVRAALRNYKMDLVSDDPEDLRRYLAQKGGPADYKVPKELNKLQPTGGGLLKWRGNPVSMACYDRGQKQMVFLFVINQAAVKDPPSSKAPELARVNRLPTASWTTDGKAYILAGEDDPEALKKYFE